MPGAPPAAPAPDAPPSPALPANPTPAPAAPTATSIPSPTMDIVNSAKMTDTGINDGVSPAIVRAEVMLDRVHASPGVIDGHVGENFVHALETYEKAKGLRATKGLGDKVWSSAFSKDIRARSLCWHIQEQVFGVLDPKTAKHLDGLARGDRSRADRPRRLKPGTVLLREYQGERHTVTVVAKGYVWREATYASLSSIARAITGTAWNGPRFFGLRIDKGRNEQVRRRKGWSEPGGRQADTRNSCEARHA